MLTIGSAALQYHLFRSGVRTYRQPADIDVICTVAEMQKTCNVYKVKPTPLSNAHWVADISPDEPSHIEFEIIECSPSGKAYYDIQPKGFASPEILYSLKRSHRFEPRHWQKHIADYHRLKDMVNAVDSHPFEEITKMRTAEMKQHHTVSLARSKEDFFDDDVSNHTFEHDQIHEIMAHREKPMFTYIADDTSGTVKSSKEKFFALRLDEQWQCVLEEAYVIALERGVIPMLYEGKKLADSKSALQWALMRICTTLTSGWFRNFAVEEYTWLLQAASPLYVEKFLSAVDDGRIKRINETVLTMR